MDRPRPVFDLPTPGAAIQVIAALLDGRVGLVIADTKSACRAIIGIVLRTAESPHVMQCPHDGGTESANFFNGQGTAGYPVQMNHVGRSRVDFVRKSTGAIRRGVERVVGRPKAAASPGGEPLRDEPRDPRTVLPKAASHRSIVAVLPQDTHLRVHARVDQATVNAIGRAGGSADRIGLVDVDDFHRLFHPFEYGQQGMTWNHVPESDAAQSCRHGPSYTIGNAPAGNATQAMSDISAEAVDKPVDVVALQRFTATGQQLHR